MLCTPSFTDMVIIDKIKVTDCRLMLLVLSFYSLGLTLVFWFWSVPACWECWGKVGLLHTGTDSIPLPVLFAFVEIQHLLRFFRSQVPWENTLPSCEFGQIRGAHSSVCFPPSCSQRCRFGMRYEQPLEQAVSSCVLSITFLSPALLHWLVLTNKEDWPSPVQRGYSV